MYLWESIQSPACPHTSLPSVPAARTVWLHFWSWSPRRWRRPQHHPHATAWGRSALDPHTPHGYEIAALSLLSHPHPRQEKKMKKTKKEEEERRGGVRGNKECLFQEKNQKHAAHLCLLARTDHVKYSEHLVTLNKSRVLPVRKERLSTE